MLRDGIGRTLLSLENETIQNRNAKVQKFAKDFSVNHGFKDDVVTYLFSCFEFSLGWINEIDYIPFEEARPINKISSARSITSDLRKNLEYLKIDYISSLGAGLVQLDLDLPEIEDIPNRKIVLTSTGKQSIRNKALKEMNDDYAKCVCGLAIYLAEKAFDVSPKIKNVLVSGYSQREDSKTNLISDQYVYVI